MGIPPPLSMGGSSPSSPVALGVVFFLFSYNSACGKPNRRGTATTLTQTHKAMGCIGWKQISELQSFETKRKRAGAEIQRHGQRGGTRDGKGPGR